MRTVKRRRGAVERLDGLRIEDESYEELINELVSTCETEELTPFRTR